MTGLVVSYNPLTGALVGNIQSTLGSGTYSAWNVNLGGAQGADGSSGTSGTSGLSYVSVRVPINDIDYAVTGSLNQLIAYTNITAERIVTLPTASMVGQIVSISDESGKINQLKRIRIVRQGTDLVDGSTYAIQISPYTKVEYLSNGAGIWTRSGFHDRLSAGILVQPTYTDNGSGSVSIGNDGLYNLFHLADGNGVIRTHEISGSLCVLTNETINYVVADYNNGTPLIRVSTNVDDINETTIIPIYTIYRSNNTLHTINWTELGLALTNKLHQSIVKTQRFRLESGLALGETPTRLVTITHGIVWYGANSISLPEFNSSTNPMYFVYHSASLWQSGSTVTTYNNTQYDNGVDTYAAYLGSENKNSSPPSFFLRAEISPLKLKMAFFTMASPKPVPPSLRERPESTL